MQSVNCGNEEREKLENSIHVPLSISRDDNEGRSVIRRTTNTYSAMRGI